jgi:hypothetical protein
MEYADRIIAVLNAEAQTERMQAAEMRADAYADCNTRANEQIAALTEALISVTAQRDERDAQAKRIAESEAAVKDAERRADEMEGKAGEWIASEVHDERMGKQRSLINAEYKLRVQMQQERDEARAEVAALKAERALPTAVVRVRLPKSYDLGDGKVLMRDEVIERIRAAGLEVE